MKFAEFLHKFLFWASPLDSTLSGRTVPAATSVDKTTQGNPFVTPRLNSRKMQTVQQVEEQLVRPPKIAKGTGKKVAKAPSGSTRADRSRRYRINKAAARRTLETAKQNNIGVHQVKTLGGEKGTTSGRVPLTKPRSGQATKSFGLEPVKTTAASSATKVKKTSMGGTTASQIKKVNLKPDPRVGNRPTLMQALNYTTKTHKSFSTSTSRQKKSWRQGAKREATRSSEMRKRVLTIMTKAGKRVPSDRVILKKDRMLEKTSVTLKTVFKVATGASMVRASLTVLDLGGLVQFYLISNVDLMAVDSKWEHLEVFSQVESLLNQRPILAYIGYMHLLLAVRSREHNLGLMRLSTFIYANMSNSLCVYDIHSLNAALLDYIDSNIEVVAHIWCELSVLHGLRFFGLRAVRPAIVKASLAVPNLILEVLQMFPPVRAAKMLYDTYMALPSAVTSVYRTHQMVASLYDPRVAVSVGAPQVLESLEATGNDMVTAVTSNSTSIIIEDNIGAVQMIVSPGILPGVSRALPLSRIDELTQLAPQANLAIIGLSLVTGIFASAAASVVVAPLTAVGSVVLPAHDLSRRLYDAKNVGQIVNEQNYHQFFTFLKTTLVSGHYLCQACHLRVYATRGYTFTKALNNHLKTCEEFAKKKSNETGNQAGRGVAQGPAPLNHDSTAVTTNRNQLRDRFQGGPIITDIEDE